MRESLEENHVIIKLKNERLQNGAIYFYGKRTARNFYDSTFEVCSINAGKTGNQLD